MNTDTKHIVIYSHGFGVRKDDRGLFPDIAAALPNAQHITFDYNVPNIQANTLTVAPLNEQVELLRQIIEEAKTSNPGATIDLVCHSQGCVVVALLKPAGIRKTILTGPPATLDVGRMVSIFGKRPGSVIDLNGISRLSRADGSFTIVPSEYWTSIEGIDPIAIFNELATQTQLTVINATQDEVLGSSDFSELSPNIRVVSITANHNFTGPARAELAAIVARELA